MFSIFSAGRFSLVVRRRPLCVCSACGMAIPVRDLWEFKPLIHSSLIANLENYPGDGQFWYPFADNAPSEHESDDDGNDDE